jgi:hypothetical protein
VAYPIDLLDVEVVLDPVLEDAEIGDQPEEEDDAECQQGKEQHVMGGRDLCGKCDRNERS